MARSYLRAGYCRLRRIHQYLQRDGQWWALLGIAFGWLLTLGTRFLLPTILPQIKTAFTIDNATAGLAISAIWASYGIMQFPAGILADWLDARTLLSTSLILASVSLGILSLVPMFELFLVGCLLLGLGTGLYGPARGIALSDIFAPHPGTAFGFTLAAGSIGSALLPFAASVLIPEFGWRTAVGVWAPVRRYSNRRRVCCSSTIAG